LTEIQVLMGFTELLFVLSFLLLRDFVDDMSASQSGTRREGERESSREREI